MAIPIWWIGCLASIVDSSLHMQDPTRSQDESPANSSDEDSFELRVLLEPWPLTPNCALESSMRGRIFAFPKEDASFILGQEKDAYWQEVKTDSPPKYHMMMILENRDIRENLFPSFKGC